MARFYSLRSNEATQKRTRTLEHFLEYRISSYGDFSLIAPESKFREAENSCGLLREVLNLGRAYRWPEVP